MPPLTSELLARLVEDASQAKPDSLDCDGCFEQLAEFAETQLAELETPEALRAVENHLRQCGCCRDEYEALLDGLREINTPEGA